MLMMGFQEGNAKMNVLLKICIKYVKHLGHDFCSHPGSQ